MKYLVVYEVYDYPEVGGGTHTEEFESEKDMHDGVEKLIMENRQEVEIVHAGMFNSKFEYKQICEKEKQKNAARKRVLSVEVIQK